LSLPNAEIFTKEKNDLLMGDAGADLKNFKFEI
jgi:hypothetical protein